MIDDLRSKADSDGTKVRCAGEEAIIEATTLTQAVAMQVKAKARDQQKIELCRMAAHSIIGWFAEAAVTRDEAADRRTIELQITALNPWPREGDTTVL